MTLAALISGLVEVCDAPTEIERAARNALTSATGLPESLPGAVPLPQSVRAVLQAADAHPVCRMILQEPLPWAPPQTSSDPTYVAHSTRKVHVELVGPDAPIRSETLRLGLYGIEPHVEYGLRTHPAAEVFIMLAGQVEWKRGDAPYQMQGPGTRSEHPSMLPHATRTQNSAFMSVYVWHGDISTDGYVYQGLVGE